MAYNTKEIIPLSTINILYVKERKTYRNDQRLCT